MENSEQQDSWNLTRIGPSGLRDERVMGRAAGQRPCEPAGQSPAQRRAGRAGRRTTSRLLAAALAAALPNGCAGETHLDAHGDAGVDAHGDAGVDAHGDAGVDAHGDARDPRCDDLGAVCGVFANGSDPIDCGECARPTPLTLEQARDELQVYPELGAELANPTSDYSRLLQTYVDAGRACHDGAWQQCLQIVEDFGVTSRPVYRIPGNAPRSNNLGDPAFYYALRVLEDAARTMAGGGAAATSPLAFTVVLFDRAEAGSNLDARFRRSASLDPKIEENGYLAVREALSDFDFLVRYWSQGRFGINLRIVRANQTVRVDNGLGAETGHEVPDFDAMSRIPTAVRTDTNLMLLVFPNMLEDYRDETIIIGGNGGTTTFCNDQWLLQKRGSLGHGPYASLERRVYMINWLQHEFMHYVFSAYPDFGLERSPHQWFDRSTWPADFEGRLEPDYYHEAIAKRIHPSGSPSLNELLKRPL